MSEALANQKLPRSHGTVPKNMAKMSQVVNTAWDIELGEKLLDFWQQRPCLFDATSREYSNRDQKASSWEEVATGLDIPGK